MVDGQVVQDEHWPLDEPTIVVDPTTEVTRPPANTTSTTYPAPPVTSSNLKYHPEIVDLRLRRKRRTVAVGVIAGVTGLILLGPLGAVIGGLGGALVTKSVGKRRERRRQSELMMAGSQKSCNRL